MEDKQASQEAEHGEDGGKQRHVPVLLEEAIHFLNVRRGGTYIDATLGLGGHSLEIAKLELAGQDPDGVIPGLRPHLDGCPACREEHESLRALVGGEQAL